MRNQDIINLTLVFCMLGLIAVAMPGCADKSNFDARALFDRHERHSGGSSE